MEDRQHTFPTSRCWTGAEEVDLIGAPPARWLYQAGWRVGRDMGDAQGFRRGYVYGHHAGEHQARLADDAFIDAIARRIRVLDDLESAVSESVRSTIARMSAHAYRARKDGEPS
ncbi:MAG: hypothetical protein ACTHX2_11630 [Microbacterium sp.]